MASQTQDDAPLGLADGEWSAEQAKKIVLGDFNRAASDRSTNHESRWQQAAAIYLAENRGEKYWEGTKTPRANMEIHHAFQQVAALRPQLVDAICGADLDFDVEAASSDTTIGQCLMVRALLEYKMRSLGGRVKFQSFRYCVDRLTEDGLIYGNGLWEWGWDGPRIEQTVNWQKFLLPEMAPHPFAPDVMVPTGRQVPFAQKTMVPEKVSQFFLDPVDLMDFYIDPNCRGTNPQMASYCVRRKMMTIAELAAYRGQEGWDVPDDKTLYRYSQSKNSTEGDTTRQAIQSSGGINQQPHSDQSVDPRLARVEVLRYWQRDHHVWLVGREHVMWNRRNQYQALPFINWCYVDRPGSFWGISLPELTRSEQKLQKVLIDSRLDELNLIIHPPFITKLGMARSQSKMKMRPGANWEAEDPSKDVLRLEMGNITASAFEEANLSDLRSQKVTGVTDLSTLGTASAGGNSANRTATGVSAQTSASSSRVQGLVATVEDQCLSPMLESLWMCICMYLDPQDVVNIIGPDGQALQLDPVDILNSDPKFRLRTANNMKMRAALQNGGLQTLGQFIFNPEIQTLWSEQQNQVLDVQSLTELWLDIYHMKARQLFRPITPQESQARAQRMQAPIQAKMDLQNARLQAMGEQAHDRDETKLLLGSMQALASAGAVQEVVGLDSPATLAARKLDAEIAGGQYDAPEPAAGQ